MFIRLGAGARDRAVQAGTFGSFPALNAPPAPSLARRVGIARITEELAAHDARASGRGRPPPLRGQPDRAPPQTTGWSRTSPPVCARHRVADRHPPPLGDRARGRPQHAVHGWGGIHAHGDVINPEPFAPQGAREGRRRPHRGGGRGPAAMPAGSRHFALDRGDPRPFFERPWRSGARDSPRTRQAVRRGRGEWGADFALFIGSPFHRDAGRRRRARPTSR